MIYTCVVSDMVGYKYENPTTTKTTLYLRAKLGKAHTYMLIFGPTQENEKAWFLAQPGIKFLYVSNPAINARYSATQKRNTVVIFEKAEPPTDVPTL